MAQIENIKVGNTTYQIRGGGNISYSTSEQDTGMTWIDGKKIYQKTLSGLVPNATTEGTEVIGTFAIGATVDKIIHQFGTIYKSNGEAPRDFPCFGTTWNKHCFIKSNANNESSDTPNTLNVRNAWPTYNGGTFYVTILYTKV